MHRSINLKFDLCLFINFLCHSYENAYLRDQVVEREDRELRRGKLWEDDSNQVFL